MAAALFAASCMPVYWLWEKALPTYSRSLATVADALVNLIELADTAYEIEVAGSAFQVKTRVGYGPPTNRRGRNSRSAGRQTDEVSYNLCLWAALLLATVGFVRFSAWGKFLIVGAAIIVFWHTCDLAIYAKNCRWVVIESLHRDYPGVVGYSTFWRWFWNWAYVLNVRIIDPLLPLLLWVAFCSRSLFAPGTETGNRRT